MCVRAVCDSLCVRLCLLGQGLSSQFCVLSCSLFGRGDSNDTERCFSCCCYVCFRLMLCVHRRLLFLFRGSNDGTGRVVRRR